MRPKTASRLAWSVGAFSIALQIGALALMFIDRHATLPDAASSARWNLANVMNAAVNIAVPAIGIVLASRRSENAIGWLFLAAGFTLGISAFGLSYGVHALVTDPGSLPAGRLFAWLGSLGLIPLGILAFLFLLFPTGHPRSARWRRVAWFVGGGFALVTAANLIFATQVWNDPYGNSTSGNVLLGVFLFAIPSLAASRRRSQRSSPGSAGRWVRSGRSSSGS